MMSSGDSDSIESSGVNAGPSRLNRSFTDSLTDTGGSQWSVNEGGGGGGGAGDDRGGPGGAGTDVGPSSGPG